MLVLPLMSIFLVGCNGSSSPFSEDSYIPRGMEVSHPIIRALKAEEIELLDTLPDSDKVIKEMVVTGEYRNLSLERMASHASSETPNERFSTRREIKIYENDVRVDKQMQLQHTLLRDSDIRFSATLDTYTALNDEETEVDITSDLTDAAGERSIELTTSPYVALDDHDTYFALECFTYYRSQFTDEIIGAASDGLAAIIEVETATNTRAAPFTFDDGSQFLTEYNTLIEMYLARGVDADTEEEYYYVDYFRIYEELSIVSEPIPTLTTTPVTYLDQPILLEYSEMVLETSVETNGNFVTSGIPVPEED